MERKRPGTTWIAGMALLLLLTSGTLVFAEQTLEETRQLLQKSLTIYELDQEIARLTEKERDIARELAETERNLAQQEETVAATREHAGKVLRAYYMGNRDSLWMLLFSAESFSDALVIYDYLTMILRNDRHLLTQYENAYAELKNQEQRLAAEQIALQEVKAEFVKQRERMLALQQEVDEAVEASDDEAGLRSQIEELTRLWEERGTPVFRTYLQAMSEAMQSLPELLSGDNRYLQGMTFQISDADLLQFFRSKNPIFNNMTIRFENGSFIAAGRDGDVEISIAGRYTVENEPVNKLQFHVDELTFNGFTLPDTSNRALEQEFDLGFEPQSYLPIVRAEEVTIADGKLTVKLKLAL